MLYRRVPLETPPEVLAERARDILRSAGYSEPPVDTAMGFYRGKDFLRYIAEHDKRKTRWNNLETGALVFWYRGSPRPLRRGSNFSDAPPGVVWTDDPPLDVSGMTLVRLNPLGRLTQLIVVPPQVEQPAGAEVHLKGRLIGRLTGHRCSLPPGSIRPSGRQRSRCGRPLSIATRALRGQGRSPSAPISRCGSRPRHTGASPSTSS